MFERFTDRCRKILALANQEAQRLNHEFIGTEHLLLGTVKEGSGIASHILKNMGFDLATVRSQVESMVQVGPETITFGRLPQTPRAKNVLERAIKEARDLNHNYVGTEHLLLGLTYDPENASTQALSKLSGIKEEEISKRIRDEIIELVGNLDKDPRDVIWNDCVEECAAFLVSNGRASLAEKLKQEKLR